MNLLLTIASLAGIWFLVVTIPGPNFVVVTKYSMSDSRKSGLFIALGVSLGAAIWAITSLCGLIVIFDHAVWLYDAIRIIGGVYLIYLGLKMIWTTFQTTQTQIKTAVFSGGNFIALRKGLFTSFANPKTAAFFGSLFVAAFPPQAPLWVYLATIGMVFTVSFIWYALLAFFFSISRVQTLYHQWKKSLDKITGAILIFLGLKLALNAK